jgi:hypothetical protein
VLGLSAVADALIPAASADLPDTLYVDIRIGSDSNSGRMPDQALATLAEALDRAGPGTDILLTGYGDRLVYPGTGPRCVTLVGTAAEPVVIRRNVYTNTLYPAVLTSTEPVRGPWRREDDGTTAPGVDTWSAPWPDRIVLTGDPDFGFVKIGGIALTGYTTRPPASVSEAAWWADGRLYLRTGRADPHRHPVSVKNGDGICLSGASRHVRIDDLMVSGAVHAVRTEPGARDIRITHMVRYNVLDDDDLAHRGRHRGPSDERGVAR